jgi:nucleoid DNA-binding protein
VNILNKGELISAVASTTGMSKSAVANVTESIINTIEDSLQDGGDVSIVGFGTWKKKARAARTGRNPQTGASINIPAKNTVTFSAGKKLKDAVN